MKMKILMARKWAEKQRQNAREKQGREVEREKGREWVAKVTAKWIYSVKTQKKRAKGNRWKTVDHI